MRFTDRHRRLSLTTTVGLGLALAVAVAPATPQVQSVAPRIGARVVSKDAARTLIVRVSNRVSGRLITNAKVTAAADMYRPHVMIFPAMPLRKQPSGTYASRYDFLMAGMTVRIRVSGPSVATTTAKFKVSAAVPPTLSRIP